MCVYTYGAYQNGAQNDPAEGSKLDENAVEPDAVASQPKIESELSLTGPVGQALVTGIDVIASAQQDEDRAATLSNALGGAQSRSQSGLTRSHNWVQWMDRAPLG